MKNLIFLILLLTFSSSCAQKTQSNLKVLPAQEYLKTFEQTKGAQLIDVRTPEEVQEGYIAGAKNINFYDENFAEQVKTLHKNQPVFLYCRSGGRSGKASQMLLEAGFTQVYDLQGGMNAWSSENMPIQKP